MNYNKIKIAKFIDNKINNSNKIIGGDSNIPGAGTNPNPNPNPFHGCPINCSCSATQSDGCISGPGVSTGEGN